MTIETGAKLPEATLLRMGADGAEGVKLSETLRGRKVVIFGLPGAYTGTCSTAHVPSFIRTAKGFADKGVDEIICVSVNDPFVMGAWGEATGATKAGLTLLADAEGALTGALGMLFSAPQIGLINRSGRWAAVVVDGVITVVSTDQPGECNLSTGEALLDAM